MKNLSKCEPVVVGEKLIRCSRNRRVIVTVDKVTPTGIIKTEHESFRPDGMRRGDTLFDIIRLRRGDPQDFLDIEKESLGAYFRSVAWETKSLETLRKIKDLM
jgi:hypothetical protein